MIYTTCVMFYAIFSHGRATSTKVLIALLVVLLAVVLLAEKLGPEAAFLFLLILILVVGLILSDRRLLGRGLLRGRR